MPFGLGNHIPGVDPEAVAATTNFDNLVNSAAMSAGKDMFGARVTNYDEKLIQGLRANPNQSAKEREYILDNMIEHRKNVLTQTAQEMQQMQSGTRFLRTPPGYSPQGGAPGAQPGMPQQGGAPIMVPQQGPSSQQPISGVSASKHPCRKAHRARPSCTVPGSRSTWADGSLG